MSNLEPNLKLLKKQGYQPIDDKKETGIVTKWIGTRTFVDIETGEKFELEYVEKKVKHSLKGGWRRVYMEDFMGILGEIAGKQVQVVNFILDHLNSENQLTMSLRMVSKYSEISYATVFRIFQYLQEKDFIKKIGIIWVVNPKFVCAFGSDKKNANILINYREEERGLFD